MQIKQLVQQLTQFRGSMYKVQSWASKWQRLKLNAWKIAPQKGYDVTIKMSIFQQFDQLMHPDSQRILRLICIGCLCVRAFTSESRVHESPACWQRSVQLLNHVRHFLSNSRSFNIFGTCTRCVGSLWVWTFLALVWWGNCVPWRRSLTTTTNCPFCSASCNHY